MPQSEPQFPQIFGARSWKSKEAYSGRPTIRNISDHSVRKQLGRVTIAGEAVARRFSPEFLRAFDSTKYLYIRAGEHRFIPIWVVVVGDRVLVRSWNDKPRGWYRALLAAKCGAVRLGEREVLIRALPPRSQLLNDATDDAYAAKYRSKSNLKYIKGFRAIKRKACTLELLPANYD